VSLAALLAGVGKDLHATNAIVSAVKVTNQDVTLVRLQASNLAFPARSRSKTCLVGITALALAVFLWGFGYKLSLYQTRLLTASRESVAKLWIEPRGVSVIAAVSHSAQPHRIPASQLLAAPIFSNSCGERAATRAISAQAFCPPTQPALIPLRSPPSSSFRLA
jgi:hypothetical protein